MKGFVLYESHNAFNLHFSSGAYDYFKYNGKTRVTEESFKKNPNRWQYAGLETKIEHMLWFMWLVYKEQDFGWVTPKKLFVAGKRLNTKYSHPNDYLEEVIKNDLLFLKKKYNGTTDLFESEGLYPNIYTDYKRNEISLETILLLHSHIKTIFIHDASDDIISWPQVISRMTNLSHFIIELFDRRSFEDAFSSTYLL